MNINNLIKLLALSLALAISLACGGGGSSSTATDNSQTTIRLAGGKAGDILEAYTLDGAKVASATFDSLGKATLDVDEYFSVRLVMEVNDVELFETFVTKDEISHAKKEGVALSVTLNAATTVMAKQISASTDLKAIYDLEVEQKVAATTVVASTNTSTPTGSTATGSIASSTVPAGGENIISVLSAQSIWNLTFSDFSSSTVTSPISANTLTHFAFSSSGILSIDNVQVAGSPALTSAFELTWTTSTLKYSASLTSTNTLNEVNVNALDGTFYGQYRETTTLVKPRLATSTTVTSLAECFTSAFGVTSISSLSLSSISSMSLDSTLLEKIKIYAILTAVAIRSADDLQLTAANWNTVVAATDTFLATTSANALSAAQTFAKVISTNLVTTTKVTTADFGTALLTFLGSADDVAITLDGLQSGEVAGALALLNNLGTISSVDYYAKGVSALESENMLEAYEYFSAAVAQNITKAEARIMAAITRMATIGIKNTPAVKAFQKAANLEYNFVGNDALEALLDQDGDDILEKTDYKSVETLTGLPSESDITTYVRDVLLVDVKKSIVDLEAVNLASFSSLTITQAMQGKDKNGAFNALSPIYVDSIDVKGLKAGMYLLKAKIEYYLSQKLSLATVNDSATNMLSTVYDATSDNLMFTGQSTYSGTWDFESGTALASFGLGSHLNKTFTFKGSFPGDLVAEGIVNADGSKVVAYIEDWASANTYWLITDHPGVYSGKSYQYLVYMEEKLAGGNMLRYTGAFAAIGGTSDWTITYEQGFSILSTYHATYTLNTGGTLALDTTRKEITETTLKGWVDSDTNFLTADTNYLSMSRDSIKAAAKSINATFNDLRVITGVNTRDNHVLETIDDLEFSNNSVLTEAEIVGGQKFLKTMVDALYGPAMVDPTIVGGNLQATSMDYSTLFSDANRNYLTTNNVVVLDAGSNLQLNETYGKSKLAATATSGNVFGFLAASFGGNTEDAYGAAGDQLNDWLDDGRLNELNEKALKGSEGFSLLSSNKGRKMVSTLNSEIYLSAVSLGNIQVFKSIDVGSSWALFDKVVLPGVLEFALEADRMGGVYLAAVSSSELTVYHVSHGGNGLTQVTSVSVSAPNSFGSLSLSGYGSKLAIGLDNGVVYFSGNVFDTPLTNSSVPNLFPAYHDIFVENNTSGNIVVLSDDPSVSYSELLDGFMSWNTSLVTGPMIYYSDWTQQSNAYYGVGAAGNAIRLMQDSLDMTYLTGLPVSSYQQRMLVTSDEYVSSVSSIEGMIYSHVLDSENSFADRGGRILGEGHFPTGALVGSALVVVFEKDGRLYYTKHILE